MDTELLNHTPEVANQVPTVEVPAPTAWPIVLAFGIALVAAGMVTTVALTVLGAGIMVAGAVGWFREMLPEERMESLQVDTHVPAVTTSRHAIDRVPEAPDRPRAWLPVEIYPVSAGLIGGLAGGAVMAVLAMLYGIVTQRSIWYPINLLAAGFFPASVTEKTADLTAFHPSMFGIAVAIHLLACVLVGLLYGATLPMLPHRPILLGGFIGPILWSGVVHSLLGIVNPVLDKRIDWPWFVVTQVGFGIVAGIVVSRHERIQTWQRMPFYIRAGIEHSGMHDHDDDREGDRR
jgi:hypothetical protein